jgi:hypothetical protein
MQTQDTEMLSRSNDFGFATWASRLNRFGMAHLKG